MLSDLLIIKSISVHPLVAIIIPMQMFFCFFCLDRTELVRATEIILSAVGVIISGITFITAGIYQKALSGEITYIILVALLLIGLIFPLYATYFGLKNKCDPVNDETLIRGYTFNGTSFFEVVKLPWATTLKFGKVAKEAGTIMVLAALPFILFGLFYSAIFSFFVTLSHILAFILSLPLYLYSKLSDKKYARTSICTECGMEYGVAVPMYVCPKCGIEHVDLRRGKYGFRTATCKCRQRMPCTIRKRVELLEAKCPKCKATILEPGVEAESFPISVIGFNKSGKNVFLSTIATTLGKYIENRMSVVQYVVEKETRGDLVRFFTLCSGIEPEPLEKETEGGLVRFWCVLFKPKRSNKQFPTWKGFYLYDASKGFDETNSTATVFSLNKGIIYVIEPSEIQELSKEKNLKVESNTLSDNFSSFMISYTVASRIGQKKKIQVPVAVVLINVSGIDLHPSKVSDVLIGDNSVQIRKFFERYRENNFLRSIDSRFDNVRFFVCDTENDESILAPPFWISLTLNRGLKKILEIGKEGDLS